MKSVDFSGFYIGAFGEYLVPSKATFIFDRGNEHLAKKYEDAILSLEEIAWRTNLELTELLPMTKKAY